MSGTDELIVYSSSLDIIFVCLLSSFLETTFCQVKFSHNNPWFFQTLTVIERSIMIYFFASKTETCIILMYNHVCALFC